MTTIALDTLSKLTPPKTKRGEQTLEKILLAAEQEFGEKGFYDGSITGIAQRAEIGQGTFYLYFKCKEDVMRELVLYLNRVVRRQLTKEVAAANNRIEAERLGLRAFLGYIRQHPGLYRILQESQFVDPEVHEAYYQAFAAAYTSALEKANLSGEIRTGDYTVWSWAIMGMMHFIGQRYVIWQQTDDLDAIVDEAINLLGRGMSNAG